MFSGILMGVTSLSTRSREAPLMYIIAIAWLYVTLLMALTESSWVAGIMTFFFYGLCPLAILLYLIGTPERRRRRVRQAQADAERESSPGDRPS
jgi:hypothetical protein